jgi:hypothetical protein
MRDLEFDDAEHVTLCEALDRVLNKGAVVVGEVTLSVANVDLIYLGLQLVLTSIEGGGFTKVLPTEENVGRVAMSGRG